MAKSGFDNNFNFIIPKSRRAPERFLQAINSPKRDNAQRIAWTYADTKETRATASKAYAFLKDAEVTTKADVMTALRNYEVEPILWKERERYSEKLAA